MLFLPTLFGQTDPLPDKLSELVTLTPAQRDLGLPDLTTEAPQQYSTSKTLLSPNNMLGLSNFKVNLRIQMSSW